MLYYNEKGSPWTFEQFLTFPIVPYSVAIYLPNRTPTYYYRQDDLASALLDADMRGMYVASMVFYNETEHLDIRLSNGRFSKSNIAQVVEKTVPRFARD